MAKERKPLTREEKIENAKKSIKEMPVTTRVKAWTFQVEKDTYLIVGYRHMVDYVGVYPSTRAGRKTSDVAVVHIKGKPEYEPALSMALDILIPQEETQEETPE